MSRKSLSIVLGLLCLFFKAESQTYKYKPSDKTVRMGESLPESFYQTIHHAVDIKSGKSVNIQLKAYRNKLIILDFWANWCSPCINSLIKLDSTQNAMKNNNYIVIPVTYQSQKEVKPIIDRFKWNMTSIVGDTLLGQIFPFSGLPHQVWIKDGKVIATPWWTYASSSNILKTLKGEKVKLGLNIQDLTVDTTKPLFINGNGNTNIYYRAPDAVIARYVKDYRPEPLRYFIQNDTTVINCVNQSLQQLLYSAFKNQIYTVFDQRTGIKWQISDSLRKRIFNPPLQSMSGDYLQDSINLEWISRNRYGYELRHAKKINENQALTLMQKDLKRFFSLFLDIELTIEHIPKKFLVLRTVGDRHVAENALRNKGKKESITSNDKYWKFYNRPFGEQFRLHLIASDLSKDLLLLDSTGIDPALKVDFITPKNIFQNLKAAQNALKAYSLTIDVEELRVPMLVVSQKGQNNVDINKTK
jgi:thiol-disulfide isomerase/thioredoxin